MQNQESPNFEAVVLAATKIWCRYNPAVDWASQIIFKPELFGLSDKMLSLRDIP